MTNDLTQRNLLTEPSPSYRWVILVFISFAMFGNYYVYDAISPLADILKSQLHFSDKNIGMLNAIYSIPNIFMVLIGGLIIDRIGTKKSSFIFSFLCMTGALITAFSGGSFPIMVAGRLIFGLGSESLIVAITTILARWFKGKELSFAFGLNLTVARLGSFAALNSPTWAKSFYSTWKAPLIITTIAAVISVLSVILYIIMEVEVKKRYTLKADEKQDKIVFKEIFSFKPSFWFITLLCVTFYSAIFPFQTFAVKFFIENHFIQIDADLARSMGGFLSSLIVLAAMILTPLFGLLADKVGKRATLMILGSLILVPVYLVMNYVKVDTVIPDNLLAAINTTHSGGTGIFSTMLARINYFTTMFQILIVCYPNLIISMGTMGIAFSLIPAVMWPSIALIVEEKKLGTAYGLMTMIQNIGLAGFNLLIGWANDISTTNGITDYSMGMWFFSITGFAGLLFAVMLRKQETGPNASGLELGKK